MNINRHEVTGFQYSSVLSASSEIIIPVSSAAGGLYKKVRITDLKLTGGAAAQEVKFWCKPYSTAGQPLEFDVDASVAVNFSWEMPYAFDIVSTTGTARPFVASGGAGADIKYSISGYIEK